MSIRQRKKTCRKRLVRGRYGREVEREILESNKIGGEEWREKMRDKFRVRKGRKVRAKTE